MVLGVEANCTEIPERPANSDLSQKTRFDVSFPRTAAARTAGAGGSLTIHAELARWVQFAFFDAKGCLSTSNGSSKSLLSVANEG